MEGEAYAFDPMHGDMHLDEKWFWMDELTKTMYLADDEEEPIRVCHNKNYRTKVMFLCALARSRFVEATGLWFDGKIDMWPFMNMSQPYV